MASTSTSSQADKDRKNPRPIHFTRADEVKTGHGQTEGMIRQVCYTLIVYVWHFSLGLSAVSEEVGVNEEEVKWFRMAGR